jgi:hypothetical protein
VAVARWFEQSRKHHHRGLQMVMGITLFCERTCGGASEDIRPDLVFPIKGKERRWEVSGMTMCLTGRVSRQLPLSGPIYIAPRLPE